MGVANAKVGVASKIPRALTRAFFFKNPPSQNPRSATAFEAAVVLQRVCDGNDCMNAVVLQRVCDGNDCMNATSTLNQNG